MKAAPETLEELSSRVEALEERVGALERRTTVPVAPVAPAEAPISAAIAAPQEPAAPAESGLLTLFGRSLLGIAGAYGLRAVAGFAAPSRPVLAIIAALYALAWLVGAARVAPNRRAAGGLYAATSMLILAPMLWEMCVRFGVLPAWAAAIMLTAYAALATERARSAERAIVFDLAYAGVGLTALALLIATHQMAYFVAILLAMIVVLEFAPFAAGRTAIRVLVALAADLAVWILIYIDRLPPGERADYPHLNSAVVVCAAVLLFTLGAASVTQAALVRQRPVSVFEAAQAMMSFGLALCAVVWLVPTSSDAGLGVACLVLAAACMASAYGPLRKAEGRRNFRVFAVWAAALMIAGVFLVVSVPWGGMMLGIAGLGGIVLAHKIHSKTFELQSVTWLAVAAFASGLMGYAFAAIVGQMPGAPEWPILAVSVCSVLAYGAADEMPREGWQKQGLHIVPALLATLALAALAMRGMYSAAATILAPNLYHVAMLRTLTLCCFALGLAFGGARLQHLQMKRVSYAVTALVAAKLLFEDLREGHVEFIAVSIGLVALTLMLVPRLANSARHV